MFALSSHVYHLLNDGPVEPLQLKVGPVNGGLWLRDCLEVLLPWAHFGVEAVIHHEDTEDVKLGIF